MTDNKIQLMTYLHGWRKGACSGAIPPELVHNKDFNKGYLDGRNALREASTKAQADYGAELSVLRAS